MSLISISKDLRSTTVRDRLAGLAALLVICPDCMPDILSTMADDRLPAGGERDVAESR